MDSAQAKGPGGQPIATDANSRPAEKSLLRSSYPLRPGETQFQVAYHMPYSGEASFSPKPLGEIQHFVVMMPKGMTFTPKDPQQFQSMPDQRSGIMVATNVKPGQDLSFRVAGTGISRPKAAGRAERRRARRRLQRRGNGRRSQAAANDNRPGGGLGAPIDAPDPLHDYRAYILGAFALVLVMGGAFVVSESNARSRQPVACGRKRATLRVALPAVAHCGCARPPRDRSALMLEAMKEELFQLEIDRAARQDQPQEYEKPRRHWMKPSGGR